MAKKYFDIEIEKSILCACLKSFNNFKHVNAFVLESDFYDPDHRAIYRAISACYDKSNKIDDLLVSDYIRKNNKDVQISIDYLLEIADGYVSDVEIEAYIAILKNDCLLRNLKQAIKNASTIMEEKDSFADIVAGIEEQILNVTRKTEKKEFAQIGEVVDHVLQKISLIEENDSELTGIDTGIAKLNDMTNGWQRGDFIILAARPSVGKTALSLQFLLEAAKKCKSNEVVLFFSLEMSSEQIAQRLICRESYLDQKLLKEPKKLTAREKESLFASKERFDEYNILINDTPGMTIADLVLKIKRAKIENNINLIVIDYIQLLEHGLKNENRQQEISKISRTLKSVAREVQVPIIALSQLSRNVEKRENKKPMMSDIRESGAIEQDADLIMFLYKENEDSRSAKESEPIEIIISKHRNGPVGTIKMEFHKKLGFFVDIN